MLTLSGRSPHGMSLADARALRDREWEARERAYHESALRELNSLVRKYNALAPYAVRRAYHVRDAELGRAYEEGGEDVLRDIEGRSRSSGAERFGLRRCSTSDDEGDGSDYRRGRTVSGRRPEAPRSLLGVVWGRRWT
ncbi:hypothetical protein F5148DRAFT_1199210 [Russula earlei]|uniref:Uncharacterized protein n=1 Tax=Russula earlei TaxID=71964 RepID=A0ACC0UAP0_9AGAM|nr:hypothetical protein F5148DRAFT_1199210 [Russula earlei]